MTRIVFYTFVFFNVFFVNGQNGKLLSKELIELSPKSLGEELFQFAGDSLIEQYRYLYDVHLYDITYESDGLVVKGALLEPKKMGKYPAIIFNRGGNRSYATMSAQRLVSTSLAELSSHGYVVISSNYRENDEYGGKDVNDVLHLIETLKEVEKAAIDRIGMYGWSRGGIMTYLALTKTDKIKTAVIGSTPSNLFDVISERPRVEENILSIYIPNYWENKDEELKKRSVIYWAEKLNKETSILILSGTKDKRVNPEQADNIAKKLDELNYDFKLKKFDTGHSFRSKQKELKILMKKWFDERLKP
jgi:dipeptidyl aminopeptidase/acylaminoacyl peptidase